MNYMEIFLVCIYCFFPIWVAYHVYRVRSLPQISPSWYIVANWILMLDYVTKLFLCGICADNVANDDEYPVSLIFIFVPIVNCGFIYAIGKIGLPRLDVRRIKKELCGGYQFRIVVFYVLALLNPLFTVEAFCESYGWPSTFSFLDHMLNHLEEEGSIVTVLSIITVWILDAIIAVACCWRWLTRKSQKDNYTGITLSSINSHVAPILFLRSFELNKSMIGGKSFDEYLCGGFEINEQPVVSLADPDIGFTNGTIKLQAKDDVWKDAVIELFKNCRAVIMFEGKSDGLNWEIDNIRKYIPHNHFFIATPPEHYRCVAWFSGDPYYSSVGSKVETWFHRYFFSTTIQHAYDFIWNRFSSRLNQAGIKLPLQNPGSGKLITFDSDWNVKNIYSDMRENDFFQKVISLTEEMKSSTIDYTFLEDSLQGYQVQDSLSLKAEKRYRIVTRILVFLQFVLTFIIFIMALIEE